MHILFYCPLSRSPSSNLALATSDLALLLVTHPVSSFLLSLTAVQQASSHATLVRALGMLLRAVHAHRLQDDTRIISKDLTNPEEPQQNSVCWWLRAHLDRFLRTLPACSADFHLLSSLLETIDEIALRSTIPSVSALGSNAQVRLVHFMMFCNSTVVLMTKHFSMMRVCLIFASIALSMVAICLGG